ncbi:MAG: hypothetical protein ACYDFV_10210 [Vulcanimicrobiaceae bacterium]
MHEPRFGGRRPAALRLAGSAPGTPPSTIAGLSESSRRASEALRYPIGEGTVSSVSNSAVV